MKSKLKKVSFKLDPAIKLDDSGYADLMQRIQEEVEGGGEGQDYEVASVSLEVRVAESEMSEDTQNAE